MPDNIIVIIGHSFVRRMRSDTLGERSSNLSNCDILPPHGWQLDRARRLAEAIKVSKHFAHDFTMAEGITFVSHLPHANNYLSSISPRVLIIDIGSNDMARLQTVDRPTAESLAYQTIQFALNSTADRVIINAVIPRTAGLSCPDGEVFFQNMTMYNDRVREACDNHVHFLIFNKQQGFTFTNANGNIPHRRPVSDWSTDGIHCSGQSMATYVSRLHGTVLDAVKSLNLKAQ